MYQCGNIDCSNPHSLFVPRGSGQDTYLKYDSLGISKKSGIMSAFSLNELECNNCGETLTEDESKRKCKSYSLIIELSVYVAVF